MFASLMQSYTPEEEFYNDGIYYPDGINIDDPYIRQDTAPDTTSGTGGLY